MNRFSTAMVKWLACGAVLLASGTAYADYKKGDEVDLTPTMKGRVIADQVPNRSSVSVEVYQNPDNKPTGTLTINANYSVANQTFSVEAIAIKGFYGNGSLTSVKINTQDITSIPTSAFERCGNLKEFDFSNIKYVHDHAFDYCISLQEAKLNDVWNIGDWAFYECQSLTKAEIGGECRIIGGMAFGKCKKLKEAILNYGLTEIGINTFLGCEALEDFILPYTITSIQPDLTDGCGLSRLFILSPKFAEWCVKSEEGKDPVGLNLVQHPGLKEIYTIDEILDDVNGLLSAYKGTLNMPDIQAKSVSELVEVVPMGDGKFKIVKHNEDIPFIEVCTSNYNGSLEDAQSFQRIFPDKDGVYTTADGKAQLVYTVDRINKLRYVVEIKEPNKYPVTPEQVVKMHGDIFPGSYDWTTQDMTKDDKGMWILNDVKVKSGNFGFRVMDNAEANDWTWVSSAADDTTVVLDAVNEGKKEGKNWYIPKGTYTFTFNPGMYELTVTGTPDTSEDPAPVWKYAIYGNILGGDWKDTDLTENDGVWSATLDDIKGGIFFINQYDTANEKKGDIISSEKGEGEGYVPVVFDRDMKAVTKDGKHWTIDAGSYTFNFNPKEMTLNVTKVGEENEDPEPAPVVETDYYLVGALPGWEPAEGYKFTKGENGEYTFEIETLTGDFKITDGDKATWYGANKDEAIELDKAYTCNTDNGENFSFSEPVLNAKFTFDPETNTLTITGTLQEIDHEYVYTLCGALTDDGKWEEYPMTLGDDGRWTLTLEKGLAVFQVREYDNAVDATQVSRYIKSNTEGKVDQNGTYSATSKGGKDWISTLDENCTYTFNPEKMILTIFGTTGVSSIEAENGEAIYFNLQGQRIACPEKGVYIRVINGKADKIVRR
ncbi:MAG: leucine-rich repeat protein [Muribaculaceae bacterium]|nr:leucine-rich repeat protein [Muribaculaceae bacterium]